LRGKVHVLNQVSPSTTIIEVKSMLHSMSNVPTDQQRLIYAGRQLEDGTFLLEFHLFGLTTTQAGLSLTTTSTL
jgi:Ubiquitin family